MAYISLPAEALGMPPAGPLGPGGRTFDALRTILKSPSTNYLCSDALALKAIPVYFQ